MEGYREMDTKGGTLREEAFEQLNSPVSFSHCVVPQGAVDQPFILCVSKLHRSLLHILCQVLKGPILPEGRGDAAIFFSRCKFRLQERRGGAAVKTSAKMVSRFAT